MVVPRHVISTETLEKCMEKACAKFKRMQQEVQEHQERQKCLEEEAAQKAEAERKYKAQEEKTRKMVQEAKAGPSTTWTGKHPVQLLLVIVLIVFVGTNRVK